MKSRWLCLGLAVLGLGPPLWAADIKKPELKSYQVPYRLTDTFHVLVRARVNGKGPFNFIIDTGAPALFVATPVAKKLGVSPDKDGWGTFDRFEIEGGLVETKVKGQVETPFQLEGMNALGLAGAELHGIIGYSLLARYRLEFDFTRDKMTWTRLDFDPGLPKRLGKGGAPGGLDALGTILKVAGMLVGKRPLPEVSPRGFLGVELADDEGSDGVVIKAVLAKSPADLAGLKAGDRVRRFQGKRVRSIADLQRLAAKLKAGQSARFTVTRAGADQDIVLKAGEGL
jgi:hypothetical protein